MTTRHILSLSGGKDSAALAIYLSNRSLWRELLGSANTSAYDEVKMEYLFIDTGKELPETYEYLDKLEVYLSSPIIRVKAAQSFDFYLKGNYYSMLPSPQARWCTRIMKLKPFEEYCGNQDIVSYVGIRADEDREGYLSHKSNIRAKFPFKEDGIVRADVFRILEETGLGLPGYYQKIELTGGANTASVGRSRSGCTFCFFQQKIEWIWLLEKHPEAFEEAASIERMKSNGYTWSAGESLDELALRKEEIISDYIKKQKVALSQRRSNAKLIEMFGTLEDDDFSEQGCTICHL